jgi:hypothetical protein
MVISGVRTPGLLPFRSPPFGFTLYGLFYLLSAIFLAVYVNSRTLSFLLYSAPRPIRVDGLR